MGILSGNGGFEEQFERYVKEAILSRILRIRAGFGNSSLARTFLSHFRLQRSRVLPRVPAESSELGQHLRRSPVISTQTTQIASLKKKRNIYLLQMILQRLQLLHCFFQLFLK